MHCLKSSGHVQRLLGIHQEVSEILSSFSGGSTLLEEADHGASEPHFGKVACCTHDIILGLLPLFMGCSGE